MSATVSLHGMTPAEIFASGIENIEQIEAVALAVKWRDGHVSTGWSDAGVADLALMLMLLSERYRVENLNAFSGQ